MPPFFNPPITVATRETHPDFGTPRLAAAARHFVPLDPLSDRYMGLCKVVKAMLPGTFLFETGEESLDDTVLSGDME
jgi:hypothetical protein